MIIHGKITGYDGERIQITAPFSDTNLMIKQKMSDCEIRLDDGRTISIDQRRKIYAIFRDISEHTGHTPENVKELMKFDFIAETGADWFSLSDVDMSTARAFLTHLVEFCLTWDIPTKDSLLEAAPDVVRFVYACLIHHKCCISGLPAELHHVDAVGMGRDRTEIIHVGMRVLPLSRKYHREAHEIGREAFLKKYKLVPVVVDVDIAKDWRL